MGDEEEAFKVTYLDVEEDAEEQREFVWIARAGRARVEYPDGATYEGDFNSEKMKHGQGTYTWVKVDEDENKVPMATYSGSYVDGKRCGVGTMKFPNGDEYTGTWKDNKMDGTGLYLYKNGDIYDGSWVNGQKQGNGCYEFGEDQSKLNGTWEAGSFTTGEWILKGAATFTGAFKGGKPIGAGAFAFASGITQTGEYAVAAPPEGEEETEEEAAAKVPVWQGKSVYRTVK